MTLCNANLDVIKGITKASCICWVLMALCEVGLDSESFIPFLDKCWLLPMHLSIDQSATDISLMNITLSYRDSERQCPSVLSLALQFSHIMSLKASQGLHDKAMNTEQRLRAVVDELESSPGFIAKWSVNNEKFRAIHSILVGTSAKSRQVIQGHLHVHKRAFSAFSSDLLRSCRWLRRPFSP